MLADAARRAAANGVSFGSLDIDEVVAFTSAVFLGAESIILSGHESSSLPIRQALRLVGRLIGQLDRESAA